MMNAALRPASIHDIPSDRYETANLKSCRDYTLWRALYDLYQAEARLRRKAWD